MVRVRSRALGPVDCGIDRTGGRISAIVQPFRAASQRGLVGPPPVCHRDFEFGAAGHVAVAGFLVEPPVLGEPEPNPLVFINGSQVVIDSEGKFESIQSLNDGDNTFTVKAQDAAGNYTEVARRVVYSP